MSFIDKILHWNKTVSLHSISIFSFLTFYCWMTFYAVVTFTQFDKLSIITLSLSYFLLFSVLLLIAFRDFFKKIVLNFSTLFISLVITYVLITFSEPFLSWVWGLYFKNYPLLDAELGLNWHQDAAYHVDLIQSIMNFGYPSIGQHDTPLQTYHVLTHYVDAVLLLVNDLEPFDSYGLLFHFKIVLFISSILFLVSYLLKTLSNFFIYIVSLIIVLVLMVGVDGGIAIGSHGLWFTNILLILFSPVLLDKVINHNFNLKNFFFIFFFIVLISLGKISTGFMLAVFLGFILLLKDPKNKIIYFLGIFLLLFFYYYTFLFSSGNSNLTHLKFDTIFKNISEFGISFLKYHIITYILFFAILSIYYKEFSKILIASLISYFILFLINMINPYQPGLYYFNFGLLSVFMLTFFYLVASKLENVDFNDIKLLKVLLGISVILLLVSSPTTISYKTIFNVKNKYIDFSVHEPLYKNRPLYNFRANLYKYMQENNLNKNNALLYIPKEIFQNDLIYFKGWEEQASEMKGLLMYAITGVPLIYGLNPLRTDFGYASYGKEHLWKSMEDFNITEACNSISRNYIITVHSFSESKFTFDDCKGIK